jgi:hypothetical protein
MAPEHEALYALHWMSRVASCLGPRSLNMTGSGPPGSGEGPGLLPGSWRWPGLPGRGGIAARVGP